METVNGTICISHAELTGRIITTSNLKALVRKGQVQQLLFRVCLTDSLTHCPAARDVCK